MGRVDRRAVEEQVVEQERVAGAELGTDDGGVDRQRGDDGGTDRPVEDRPAGSGLDDVIETSRQQVYARRVDAAVGQGHPDVEGPDAVAEEGASWCQSVLAVTGTRCNVHLLAPSTGRSPR
jgi:hypothetical protein